VVLGLPLSETAEQEPQQRHAWPSMMTS